MKGTHVVFDGTGDVTVPVPVIEAENVMIPVIRAVVVNADEPGLLLLQRRSNPSEAVFGLLEIPGGLWRSGESPVDAIRREISEETALSVSEVVGVVLDEIDDRRSIATITPLTVIAGVHGGFPATHTVLVVRASGSPRGQAEESHDVRWWKAKDVVEELRQHPGAFVPSSRAALLAYFAAEGSGSG